MTQPPPRYCTACGARLAPGGYCPGCPVGQPRVQHAGQSVPAPPDVRGQPVGRRRRWAAIVIAAVVGAMVLCVTPLRAAQLFLDPGHAVRSYFDALANRDADKARALLATGSGGSGHIAGVSEQADLSLLTNGTLRSRGYTPPRNVDVEAAIATGGDATVEVTYDFGGPSFTMKLPMTRESGFTWQPWRIADGLLELPLSASTTDRLVVAGTTLPVPPGSSRTLVALPGAYRVTIPEHPLFDAQPATAFAGGGNVARQPELTVRKSVREDVERQVRAHVDNCAGSTELAPPGCPFDTAISLVTNVRWKIISYPELELKVADGGTVSVGSPTQGVVEMTADRVSGTGPPVVESRAFEVHGTVRAVDGKPVLSFERW